MSEKQAQEELQNADIIQTFIQQGSKQETISRLGLPIKEVIVDGRDAHTPYTQAQSLDGRLVDNNISSTTKSNSTKESNQNQTKPKIRKQR